MYDKFPVMWVSVYAFQFYIEREKCVVIVTSTTGDGEPPDTALKFIRRLKKKTLPGNYLSHLNYALLGERNHWCGPNDIPSIKEVKAYGYGCRGGNPDLNSLYLPSWRGLL